jgi:RNA polymerase sigma factor (sigma-70 family)
VKCAKSAQFAREREPYFSRRAGVSVGARAGRRTIASRFKKKRPATVPLVTQEALDAIDLTMPARRREATPHDHYECVERIAQLESKAARHLTSEQRQLFELHHLHHQSIREIAREFDKTEDAVKSDLYRARHVLLAP